MAEVDNQLEIKFRLTDGSDIGPKAFPDATTVSALKETVISQWPRGQFLYACLPENDIVKRLESFLEQWFMALVDDY